VDAARAVAPAAAVAASEVAVTRLRVAADAAKVEVPGPVGAGQAAVVRRATAVTSSPWRRRPRQGVFVFPSSSTTPARAVTCSPHPGTGT
jgi:hypothetical protein